MFLVTYGLGGRGCTRSVVYSRRSKLCTCLAGRPSHNHLQPLFCFPLPDRGGDPGAKVIADAGVPATRENRLLSWASEMEAQLVSQRQDLRRARMELAAAQQVRSAPSSGARA